MSTTYVTEPATRNATTYVSIDVATKSLALGIYQISDRLPIITSLIGKEELGATEEIDSLIVPIMMDVVDLNPDKKSKEIPIHEKAIALKNVLTKFDEYIPSDTKFVVLIEYQMNANHMSNAIFNMIAYHYAGRAEVNTVFPSLKNTFAFHPKLSHSNMLAISSTNYIANKNHCKYNFMYFMTMFGYGSKCAHIKAKNLDDIADTFMQCVAWHKRTIVG